MMRSVGGLAVFCAVSIGCGSSSSSGSSGGPSTVTQSIGPEGGTINVAGATITFPKGALAAPLAITITAGGAPPDGFVLLSSVFRCEPSGTDFAQAVTMQMPFTDDGKGGSVFWSSGSDPTFKNLGGTVQGATMIAPVMHFSAGFVGRPK